MLIKELEKTHDRDLDENEEPTVSDQGNEKAMALEMAQHQWNDQISLLIQGPEAAIMTRVIVILGSAAKNVSLITPNQTAEDLKAKKIQSPDSLQAALFQVTNEMGNIFRLADRAMRKIGSRLADLPKCFQKLIELRGKTGPRAKRLFERHENQVNEANVECVALSSEIVTRIEALVEVVSNLQAAVTTVRTHQEQSMEKNQQARNEFVEKKSTWVGKKECLDKEKADADLSAAQMLKEYKRQLTVRPGFCENVIAHVGDWFSSKQFVDKLNNDYRQRAQQMGDKHERAVEQQKEARRKLEEFQKNMWELTEKLHRLDLNKADLNDVLASLKEAFNLLSKVQANWESLNTFFDSMHDTITKKMKPMLTDFASDVAEEKDPAPIEDLLEDAVQMTEKCVLVQHCASVYTRVSNKYILPEIGETAKGTMLTMQEAEKAKNELLGCLEPRKKDVISMIEAEKKAFVEETNRQMAAHWLAFKKFEELKI